MVVIRLRPQGKKRQKTYRIVVDNKRSKLDGKFIEDLGWLDRHNDDFDINEERAKHWISVGAQPSDTVYNLFITAGIIDGKKRKAHSTRKRGDEVEEENEDKTEEAKESSTEEVTEDSSETEDKKDEVEEESSESEEGDEKKENDEEDEESENKEQNEEKETDEEKDAEE